MINKNTTNRFVVLTPFQKPITYYSRQVQGGVASDAFTAFSLSRCRSRELEKKDVALNPELLNAVELVFEIWQPVMDAVEMPAPKKDDYLIDSNCCRSWTVFSVLGEFNQNVWTLFCTRRV